MKKILAALALSAFMLGGCTSNTAASPASSEELSAAQAVEKDSSKTNAGRYFQEIFTTTSKNLNTQIEMDTEISGNKVNFLNAGELVQMDSTVVDGYEDNRLLYPDGDTLYLTSEIENQIFTAYCTQGSSEKVLSAHKQGSEWEVFEVSDITASSQEDQVVQFLSIPFNYQQLQSEAFHLNPLEDPQYYTFGQQSDDNGTRMVISIKNKEDYIAANEKLMVENQYNMDIFEKYTINNDTYTLSFDEKGTLVEVVHEISAVYVIDGIEQKEQITTKTEISQADDVDVSFLKSLLADDMKAGSTFKLPE